MATRQAVRTPRAAAIAGILFALLLGAALIIIHVAVPSGSRDAGTWVIDDSNRRAVLFALNLLPFAGIAFLWFIGVVRARMGEREDRFFATVFLGSGLLFVAMLFAAGAIAGALLDRSCRRRRADRPRSGRTGGGSPTRSSRSTRCGWRACS